MKKILMMLFVLTIYNMVSSQIPNNGFENWSTDGGGNLNPDYWLSPNDQSAGYTPIERVTGFMGSYAMRVYTPNVGGLNIPSAVVMQFPSTLRPTALTGYYKSAFAANDSSYIDFASSENGSGIGAGALFFSTNQATFQAFSIPVYYGSANNPDTISIAVGSGATVPSPGADMIIDELSFSFTSGIEIPVTSSLISGGHMDAHLNNYIFYILSDHLNRYDVRLFDLTGTEMLSLNYEFPEGKHLVTLPVYELRTGLYVLKVSGGPTFYSQKIYVSH